MVGAAVGEVLFVVDFGCGGGAAGVVELAGVVVAVEGGLSEFLPLSGGESVWGLVVPCHLCSPFFVFYLIVVVCTCVY